jgi:hypothetical protein
MGSLRSTVVSLCFVVSHHKFVERHLPVRWHSCLKLGYAPPHRAIPINLVICIHQINKYPSFRASPARRCFSARSGVDYFQAIILIGGNC